MYTNMAYIRWFWMVKVGHFAHNHIFSKAFKKPLMDGRSDLVKKETLLRFIAVRCLFACPTLGTRVGSGDEAFQMLFALVLRSLRGWLHDYAPRQH